MLYNRELVFLVPPSGFFCMSMCHVPYSQWTGIALIPCPPSQLPYFWGSILAVPLPNPSCL